MPKPRSFMRGFRAVLIRSRTKHRSVVRLPDEPQVIQPLSLIGVKTAHAGLLA